jgi:hypothetical protein
VVTAYDPQNQSVATPARLPLLPAAFKSVNITCSQVTKLTPYDKVFIVSITNEDNTMKCAAAFAVLALLFCAATASWDGLDNIHLSSELEPVNEDIIPRLLQEVLGDAAVPGAYGVSACSGATSR